MEAALAATHSEAATMAGGLGRPNPCAASVTPCKKPTRADTPTNEGATPEGKKGDGTGGTYRIWGESKQTCLRHTSTWRPSLYASSAVLRSMRGLGSRPSPPPPLNRASADVPHLSVSHIGSSVAQPGVLASHTSLAAPKKVGCSAFCSPSREGAAGVVADVAAHGVWHTGVYRAGRVRTSRSSG